MVKSDFFDDKVFWTNFLILLYATILGVLGNAVLSQLKVLFIADNVSTIALLGAGWLGGLVIVILVCSTLLGKASSKALVDKINNNQKK